MSETYKDVAEKTYHAIGRFIFEFSQVEYTLRDCLGQEAGIKDEYFSPLIESYDVSILCTIADRVFEKSMPDYRYEKMKKLINEFRELIIERNRIAHGLWVPFKDGGTLHHVSRNKLKPDILANRAAAVEKLADAACTLRAEIERVFSLIEWPRGGA